MPGQGPEKAQHASNGSGIQSGGPIVEEPAGHVEPAKPKSLLFAFAFATISLVAFTSALEAQILAIALPVRLGLAPWSLLS